MLYAYNYDVVQSYVICMYILQLVPIIDKVSVKTLNLSRVLVNITLLTDGGQRVMYYEVRGRKWLPVVV